ncbi:Putative hem degrading protein HbpS [Septoria linicola]|uniref:Hem degrading protein HbpS n=1 Tax=Septoria linicola TaxID=215465 RepID=A0A9Q9AJS7_9PEZI|nr:Putative hem degrading protein HbpS [Septoria linicola]
MAAEPTIPMPPRELEEIAATDKSLSFPTFTSHTAWVLGSLLRTRLLAFAKPTVIDISLAHGTHCLFHAVTHSGTAPDNDSWVARKRNTVLRFGNSTWYMHNKFAGDEAAFNAKFALGTTAKDYAIHGGGFPVRVQGVEGIVAVIVVSGLKQEQDHGIILQVVREYLEELGIEMGEKKKED